MKIAVASDDGTSISAHLGRAAYYVVFNVEEDRVVERLVLPKENFHQHRHREHGDDCHRHSDREHRGTGKRSEEKHRLMFAAVADCQVLIARGMGYGAQRGLQQLGIQPVLTDLVDSDDAVAAFLAGELVNRPDRVH